MQIARKLVRLWPPSRTSESPAQHVVAASQRRRAFAAVGTGLIAFAILHIGLAVSAEFSRFLRDPIYADKERKLAALERELPLGSPVVAFIGTSRTNNGFEAGLAQRIATADLGYPTAVFNWGLPASGPVTHLLHLRRILGDGHRPSVVLLEILPVQLAEMPDGPLEGRYAEGLGLEWSELDWTNGYRFPTDRLRRERQSALLTPWYSLRFKMLGRIVPTDLPFNLRYDWSRGKDANGWSPILMDDIDEGERAMRTANTALSHGDILGNLALGEAQVRALREALTLCRQNGITAALVRMPEATAYRALYPLDVSKRIAGFLNLLAAEYGCRLCNASGWMSDDSFSDGHHLLRRAAGPFSTRLTCEVIEPMLKDLIDNPR